MGSAAAEGGASHGWSGEAMGWRASSGAWWGGGEGRRGQVGGAQWEARGGLAKRREHADSAYSGSRRELRTLSAAQISAPCSVRIRMLWKVCKRSSDTWMLT